MWVVASNDTVTITNSTFDGNTGDQLGAIGVMAGGSSAPTDLVISGSSFIDNEALAGYGGAISAREFNNPSKLWYHTDWNTTFEGNTSNASSSANGGAI